jgi:hypothetical protein
MWQFSITYNSITTIIDEPVGWDETEIIVKRNKDYHGFMEALKIPEQDILQYALSRVQ